MKDLKDFIYKKLSSKLIGAAIEVHKVLGMGFLEAVYQESLEYELFLRQIPFESQLQIEISYKGIELVHKYKPDFIIDDKIIVEIKAKKELTPDDEAQLLNYLKATGLKLGFLFNFGEPILEFERRVATEKFKKGR
jgi:GxxExxY protein